MPSTWFYPRLPDPPIVIGGCARSGTTLLLSLLSCHPAVYAIPQETCLLCPGAYSKEGTIGRAPSMTSFFLLLNRSEIPHRCRRWAEKTPKNALCYDMIHRALPEARIINLIRDGRDVVTSIHPSDKTRYWVGPARWVREVTAANGQVAPRLTIRYEDLVSNTEATLQQVLRYAGVPWSPQMLNYPEAATVRSSAAWIGRDARPLDAAGIERWRRLEHKEQIAAFHKYPGAVKLLTSLGYALG